MNKMAISKQQNYFIREFHIDTISKTLVLNQHLEGDVNCVVWDASIVLAKYLEELAKTKRNFFQDLNVIELGAGVGCVGLTAACLGANVLLTDLTEALPLLKSNVENNKNNFCIGTAKVCSLVWGEEISQGINPDYILLADCVYYEKSIDPLIDTLRALSTEDTTILISQELRESEVQQHLWKYFVTNVKKYFLFNIVPLKEQNSDYCSPDILLVKLRKL